MKKRNIVKKKEDFSRIIGKKQGISTKYFIINSEDNKDKIPKFGITFTKHIGNAVARNKIKRRLKSIIDNNKNIYKDKSYIIIAKKNAIDAKYKELEYDLIVAFDKINKKGE